MESIHFIMGGRGYGKTYCMKKIKYNLQVKTDKWVNFNDKLYNLEAGHKKLEKLKKKFPSKKFRLKQIKITKI
ncbi:MAG: hypothetical protein OSJ63_05555 [Bacilli bacterium]|nr:hypothetical protein [Bacilli bacterium]